MLGQSGATISSTTLIFIIAGIFGLALLVIITTVLYTRRSKKDTTNRRAEAFMGTFASKIGWISESNSNFNSSSNRSSNRRQNSPTAGSDSDSQSSYQLPDFRRLSAACSISQAVFQVFRNSQLSTPHEQRAKLNVATPQWPRWSRWFGRQPNDESSILGLSSPLAGGSPLTEVDSIDDVHGRLSLSSFPRPPLQHSNSQVYTPNMALVERTGSSDILRHPSRNPKSISVVVWPSTNVSPNYLKITRPAFAYPQNSNRSPTRSALSPGLDNIDQYEEVNSPQSRARVVSNSTSWQHRSMHVEISVLPSENQASSLNSTPTSTPSGTTFSSKLGFGRHLHVYSVADEES